MAIQSFMRYLLIEAESISASVENIFTQQWQVVLIAKLSIKIFAHFVF